MYANVMHPLLRDTAGFFILLFFALLVALVIGLGTGEPAQFLGAVSQPAQNVQNIQRTACVLQALPVPSGRPYGIRYPYLSRPTFGSSEYFATSDTSYTNYPPQPTYPYMNGVYAMGNGAVGPGNRGWSTVNPTNGRYQNAATYGGTVAYNRLNRANAFNLITQYAGPDRLIQTADDNYYLTAEDIPGILSLGPNGTIDNPGSIALARTGVAYVALSLSP